MLQRRQLLFPIYWVPQRVGRALHKVRYVDGCRGAFPIYWVPQRVGSGGMLTSGNFCCGFPIYWVPQRVGRRPPNPQGASLVCFQFIGFPSEWGDSENFQQPPFAVVSNLLGSPASGEFQRAARHEQCRLGFQFIGFPSEWGDTPIETRMARACQGAFASISPNRYTLYCF